MDDWKRNLGIDVGALEAVYAEREKMERIRRQATGADIVEQYQKLMGVGDTAMAIRDEVSAMGSALAEFRSVADVHAKLFSANADVMRLHDSLIHNNVIRDAAILLDPKAAALIRQLKEEANLFGPRPSTDAEETLEIGAFADGTLIRNPQPKKAEVPASLDAVKPSANTIQQDTERMRELREVEMLDLTRRSVGLGEKVLTTALEAKAAAAEDARFWKADAEKSRFWARTGVAFGFASFAVCALAVVYVILDRA